MTTYSITEFAQATIASHIPNANRPEAIWNLGCTCGKHTATQATVRMADLPAIATTLGFGDTLSKNDLYKKLPHAFLTAKESN